MNIDVREYLRINPISSFDLTLSDKDKDCFLYFWKEGQESTYQANTQEQMFTALRKAIFQNLIDDTGKFRYKEIVPLESTKDNINYRIDWGWDDNPIHLSVSQFKSYVRREKTWTDHEAVGHNIYEWYSFKDQFEKELTDLEERVDRQIDSLTVNCVLRYKGAVELMSDVAMEVDPKKTTQRLYNDLAYAVGQIWCKKEGSSKQTGSDRSTVDNTINHVHNDTKAETMTSSFSTDMGGGQLLGKFNIGDKQLVASDNYAPAKNTEINLRTPIAQSGHLTYPLSGQNVLDWRNPDRTHNNIPPSYNIYVRYVDKIDEYDKLISRAAQGRLNLSVIEAQYESNFTPELEESYTQSYLSDHDYFLRIVLDDNNENELMKQSVKHLLDIFANDTENKLGHWFEFIENTVAFNANGGQFDPWLVKFHANSGLFSGTDLNNISFDDGLRAEDYVLPTDPNKTYKFIPMAEVLKSYFNYELVPLNEFNTWVNEMTHRLDVINKKIYDIQDFVLSIKPVTYVGRIIMSVTDDIESKVIKNYGGKRWRRIVNFLRGVECGDQKLGDRSGEEFVCLRESSIPTHTHNFSLNQTDTLNPDADAPLWMSSGKGGANTKVLNTNKALVPESISGVTNSIIDYQLSPLEYESQEQHVTLPHDNMPPYKEIYIWECVELTDEEDKRWSDIVVDKYKIHYNLNGHGELPQNALTEYSIRTRLPYIPPTIQENGYDFNGWNPISIMPDSKGDVTFNANWNAHIYSISYNLNGHGQLTTRHKSTYTIEDSDFIPEALTEDGYDFNGWTPLKISHGSTGDKVFYANWSVKEYTVRFFLNDGTSNYSEKKVTFNSRLGTYPIPKQDGFAFNNWWTSPTGGEQVTNYTLIKNNLDVYARWVDKYANVTFDSCLGSPVPSTRIEKGKTLGTLPSTTRVGYTQNGWWTEQTSGNQINESTIINNDVTFYAHWNINTYTVKLIDRTSEQNISVQYNNPVGTLPTPEREGYRFTGWKSESGVIISETTPIVSDIVCHSQWQAIEYTITYDMNGHGVEPSGLLKKYTIETDTYTPTNADDDIGYTFIKWNPEKISKGSIGNKSFVAQWQGKSQTIRFVHNDETDNITTRVLTYDTKLGGLPNIIRTGYTINGWWTDPTGGREISENTLVKGDATYYAHWNINTYTVTYDGNGCTPSKTTEQVQYNRTISSLPTVSYEGHTLIGWFTLDGTPFTATTPIVSDITVQARWDINTYTIEWVSNGGSSVEKWTRSYGTEYGVLPTSTRNGYSLNGWWSGESKAERTTIVTRNMTYTARWDAYEYSITYNMNGHGVKPSTAIDTYTIISRTYTPPTPATVSGYTFNGWNPTSIPTGSTGNKQFTANWVANEYTVTFNPNGGSQPSPASKKVTFNQKIGTLPSSTRTNYIFNGWWNEATNTKITENTIYNISRDYTYYARWNPGNITVYFNGNGGVASVPSQTITYNTAISSLPTASRTGYDQKGWWTASTGGTELTSSTNITENGKTYYAHWLAKQYRIDYNLNGKGTNTNTKTTYTIEESFTPNKPTAPTGYTFNSWSPTSIPVGSTGNKTFTASWTPINYTITWDVNGGTKPSTWSTNTRTIAYGSAIGAAPTDKPTRAGYTFDDWYTSASGGTKFVASTICSGNATYYAHWNINSYTVTYNANGGSGSRAKDTVTYNGTISSLPTCTRAGYTFNGWYNGSTKLTTSTKITTNITYIANWTANTITVTFNSNY